MKFTLAMENPIFIFQRRNVNYSGSYCLLLSMEKVRTQRCSFPLFKINFHHSQFLLEELIQEPCMFTDENKLFNRLHRMVSQIFFHIVQSQKIDYEILTTLLKNVLKHPWLFRPKNVNCTW